MARLSDMVFTLCGCLDDRRDKRCRILYSLLISYIIDTKVIKNKSAPCNDGVSRKKANMSLVKNSTSRWFTAALIATLLIPSTILAVAPARQSRILIIHARDSSDGILELFRSAAIAAGLQCHRLEGWDNPGVQCLPTGGGHLGLVNALDVTANKSVVISAFSSNVSTPHGELEPSVKAALVGFRRTLKGNPTILRIDECAAPTYSGCLTKRRDRNAAAI